MSCLAVFKSIKARDLMVGMEIKNIYPNPDQKDVVSIQSVNFLSGKTTETDQVAFECEYGWAYLYASQLLTPKGMSLKKLSLTRPLSEISIDSSRYFG